MLRGDANENSQKKKQVVKLRCSTFLFLLFELSKNNAKICRKSRKKKKKNAYKNRM